MRVRHAHNVIQEAHAGVLSASGYARDDTWQAAAEATEKRADALEKVLEVSDPEIDNLILQYIGDIRCYALLSREEEHALWQRIEWAQRRTRRALSTSPLALQTLSRVWQQVQREQLPTAYMIETEASGAHDRHAPDAHLERVLPQLKALAARLHRARQHHRATSRTAGRQHTIRQERVRLWHQWLAIWETLPLHASMYDAMHFALEMAYQAQPDDPALHAAYCAWERAQRDVEQAKAQMLRANLRLVVYVAKRYRHRGVPLLDLIQEGNIGLMRALDKFEPQRGLKFITYAHWWVHQTIRRAIIQQRSAIRLPSYLVDRRNKLRVAATQLGQLYGRAPTVQELSHVLGWTPREVVALQAVKPVLLRLHEPVTDDGRRLDETIEDEHTPQPDTLVANTELRRYVEASLANLSEREARLLRLRFGFETDHPYSLQEIGTLFGLSRERIRQLEKIALEKLRHSASGATLADFIGQDGSSRTLRCL